MKRRDEGKEVQNLRIKQWIAGAAVFALTAFLILPNSVQAQEQTPEQSSSATTITTQVPYTHSAELTITGEGTVTVSGNTYTETATVQIPRLEEVSWQFDPADGYVLKEVFYNGTDVTEELSDNTYAARPVNEDGTEVRVVFVKDAGSSGNPTGSTGGTGGQTGSGTSGNVSGKDSPKTGDETELGLWTGMMAVSMILVIALMAKVRKKKV